MMIRSKPVTDNAGGRSGCQVRSPYSGATYYVTLEHGAVVLRDWGGAELARDPDRVTLVPLCTSAHFANETQLVVTIAGFSANTNNSRMDTYLLALPEGL